MLGGAHIDPVAGATGLQPSSQLGKYQLLRRIAMGGMAELFLARAVAIHGFEKLVVLKRILPQHAESEDFIRMFLAEARLAATLHHPNIVQVYDIGEDEGACFFTMEYVQGQDLRKLVRAARKADRALPLEHILHIVMGVAAGLHHAHEKIGLDGQPLGIVHRDVSPSNVLVTYEGGVKIVDFGIAKATTAQSATIAGTLKGKIPYMSPEQCRGEVVDRRSDIFSIGTLLWELTTGARLFTGENEFAIINRVAAGAVPLPSTVRPDYPPELEAIVMRALTADREQRYATALDLQIDLEDFAREARLPVSSARMAKFMRELFAEEMRQAMQMLQADRLDEQPTMPRPALSREALLGSSFPGMPTESESSGDVTPSEVRADAGQGTPTGAQASFAAGSATGIGISTYEEPDEVAPRTSAVAVALAVVVGMLAVLGLSGAVWFLVLADDEEAKKPRPDLTPAVIVETPASEPAPTTTPPVPVEPAADVPPVVEGADAGGATAKPADSPGASSPADSEPATPASEPEPEEPSPPPKDDKKASADDTGRSATKRTPPKRTGTKSTSGSKSKWDPDSPFAL